MLFQRSKDAELARLDYTVYAQANIVGIAKQQLEAKLNALTSLKETAAAVLYQDAYSESYQKAKAAQRKQSEDHDKQILEQVKSLSKPKE